MRPDEETLSRVVASTRLQQSAIPYRGYGHNEMTLDEKHPPPDAGDGNATSLSRSDGTEHDTLKYHLLGPSLTKAGQDQVDQQKVKSSISYFTDSILSRLTH